jgi:hypothetical protein
MDMCATISYDFRSGPELAPRGSGLRVLNRSFYVGLQADIPKPRTANILILRGARGLFGIATLLPGSLANSITRLAMSAVDGRCTPP